jgi:ubiquinone/menaquinone biosynthesis C-methylase UbiE
MHDSIIYAQYKAQSLKDVLASYNRPGIKILDVGSGEGALTYYLQEVFFYAQVVGIDTDHKKVMHARKDYPDIQFLAMEEVHTIPFTDNFFDVVIASDVFHHIARSDHQAYSAECMRVVKPGGCVALTELNPWNYQTRTISKENPEEHGAQLLSPYYARTLLSSYGNMRTYFYGLFPQMFEMLTFLEPWMRSIPLGRIYIVTCTKR